jgi:RNA polymerase-binding transcription factor DksA
MPTIAQLVGQDNAVVEHVHSRKTFAQQRRDALVQQRDGVQARLDNLRKEIRKVQAKAGVSDDKAFIEDAIAKLERMGRAEAKLVEDIARLTAKIGA